MEFVLVAGHMITDNSFISCPHIDPRVKKQSSFELQGKVLEKDTDWPSMGHVSILDIVTVDKKIGYYNRPDLGHMHAHENKGGVGPVFESPIRTV